MPAQHVRDLPVRGPRPDDRPHRHRQRRAQPAVRAQRRRHQRAARNRHAAGPACPASATRRSRASSSPTATSCSTATDSSRRTTRAREMFGFDRLREALAGDDAGSELLDRLLETLRAFTGPDHEQEDDITLVTLRRSAGVAEAAGRGSGRLQRADLLQPARRPGNEREAMDRVAAARGRSRPADRPPGAAEDGGERDRHERHRIRQPGSRRRPVRRGRRGDARPTSSSG